MKFNFLILPAILLFSSHLASAASTVQTQVSLLCEESGNQPVKIRVALIRNSVLILKHERNQEADTVLHKERISNQEISETVFKTTIKVDGVFEWIWIRKPGMPGYKGTLQVFTPIAGWPANSLSLDLNCSLDQYLSYYL